ncbi:hypothetical protein DFH07DRAFT_953710 [Mycena maculata]|uniref:Ndc10 domain-containing protein n=1 Tax=Mycena maculata TaxID=230809 RepID=A0AAD7NQR1_9AGAR|nr:hypothetical protein DFH07DRAFT_953710 [Mycena maculata]
MSTAASLPIDPVLLASPERSDALGSLSSNGAIGPNGDAARLPPLPHNTSPPTNASKYLPGRDETRSEYEIRLTKITRKAPLQEACKGLGVKVAASWNLETLRDKLARRWFPSTGSPPAPTRPPPATTCRAREPRPQVPGRSAAPVANAQDIVRSVIAPENGAIHLVPPTSGLQPVSSRPVVQHRGEMRGGVPLLAPTIHSRSGDPVPSSLAARLPAPTLAPPSLLPSAIPRTPTHRGDQSRDGEVVSPLVHIPPIQEGAGNDDDDSEAALLRRYDAVGANTYEMLSYEDDEDEEDEEYDEDDEDEPMDRGALLANIRVAAVKRTEANRRAGGRRTQQAMCRAWMEFVRRSIDVKKIPDSIVDEISLLLFIQFSAERPKRTRKGHDIPGTRVGASQLKKLFFGALRIRKEQDAANPALVQRRPATSVTDTQLAHIGVGFLSHTQLRLCIWGHLAWTAQHASGNRGDDFRALKLAELQPHNMLHPDKRTSIYSVLGLQSEEKAGKRGMRTVINPVYSVFIANLKPEMCPLGAFAFYFHYIYDEKKIIETMGIDWASNKSWRPIRLLHGPKSPTTPFSEQCLYNLYCKAFSHAGFKSRLKVHLPRHILGYKQEALGVDPLETSKLGWVRGQTYMDTYAPALPKTAILGAAGYQSDEPYDPLWRHVRVPEQFLRLVCPMAEEVYASIAGKENLSGAANHWLMVIELREYLFQCGAAIWQIEPQSALFRLPAFQNQDVRHWMTSGYPSTLSGLQASAGNPVDLQRIENIALVSALHQMRDNQTALLRQISAISDMLNRRTSIFTPARGFSSDTYYQNAHIAGTALNNDIPPSAFSPEYLGPPPLHAGPAPGAPSAPCTPLNGAADVPRTPFNSTPEAPCTLGTPTLIAQVELVLPPVAAFYAKGRPMGVLHPVLGMRSARWIEDVFPAIKQPQMCWDVWGPTKTMDDFDDLQEIWNLYAVGERVSSEDGSKTRTKPPLKIVEQHFQHRWRTSEHRTENNTRKKFWSRFREIPEWIDRETTRRHVQLDTVVAELQAMRARDIGEPRGINWLANELARLRKEDLRPPAESTSSLDVEGSSGKKKRAAAVDARRPGAAKKLKT